MQTTPRSCSGWALSPREVAIPIDDLEAGRVPAVSVRSGKLASASTPVIHRPRLILRRSLAWGILVAGNWAGLLLMLVWLPAVLLLYPHSKWLTRALPAGWRARGVLPVTAGEARWISGVRKGATLTGLGAALLIVVLVLGVPDSIAPLAAMALATLVLIGIVLGGIDYSSLPVGKLTTIGGRRVVVLQGVHPNFVAAVQDKI
jgi:hypothetical protein